MVADEIAQIENQRKRNDMRNKTSSCIKEEWHDEVLEIADDGAQNGTKTLRHLQSHTCLAEISCWMKDHHLQLNLARTELIVVSANPSFHHNFTI